MTKYQPKQKNALHHRNAVVNTLLVMMGIYIVFLLMILSEGTSGIYNVFVSSQASLAGMYVNALAIISVTYGKFSTMDLIRVSTYFLSIFALFIVINIFAQALYVVNPTLWTTWDWFRSPEVTYILQIALAISIYKLELQEEVKYKKNKIR